MRGIHSEGPGRYRVRVYFTDPKTGKQRELVRVVEANDIHEASEIRAQLRREAMQGGEDGRPRPRLADYAESWLSGKLPSLKASTRDRYAEVLDVHVLPVLGDHWVDAIERDDLIAWRDSQRGAVETVNGRLRVLLQVLRDAVVDLGLDRDPTLRVESRRVPGGRVTKRKGLDAAELRDLLAAIQQCSPRWYPLVLTLAFTGLRFGEATALRWEDVDLDEGIVRVVRAQWKGHVDHPKAKASRRTVAMAPDLVDVLRKHHEHQKVRPLPTGYLFLSNRGTLLYNSVLTKPVRKALEVIAFDFEARRFPAAHGFRHTYNNLLRQVAHEQVRQSMMGHADEAMRERYSHVDIGEKRSAAGAVVDLVRSA